MNKTSTKDYWGLLKKYLRPQWRRGLLLVIFLFSTIGLQLLNPQILRYFIDTVVVGGTTSSLLKAAGLFLLISFLTQGVYTFSTYVSTDIAWNATNTLRYDLAKHVLNLDMSFHNEHTPGEIITRLDDDVANLSNFFSDFAVRLGGNFLLMIGIIALIFRENLYIGIAFTVYSVIALAVINHVRELAAPSWLTERRTSANLFSFIEERFSGIVDIRTSGAFAFTMRRYFEKARNYFLKRRRAHMMNAILSNSINTLLAVGYVGAFAIGVFAFQRGAITIGTVYLIIYYIRMLAIPLQEITGQIDFFQLSSASIQRIQELLQEKSKIQDRGVAHFSEGPPHIQYQDVSFAYEDNKIVLNNISFELEPGRVLGLLGRTGSGKTTLTRILFRLYETKTGNIYLDKKNIRELPLTLLRQHIGLVTQNIQLFNGTMRDNMTFFDENISDEQLIEVIKELGLWPWYQSLPDGLDTELFASGAGLSAGEAQLLAFTRVFLKDPTLIIMDEASSRLDPATEQLIERAIDRLLQGRTSIIIAHRLRTVQRADSILILENGRILEYGSQKELLHDTRSHFSRLMQTSLEEVLA